MSKEEEIKAMVKDINDAISDYLQKATSDEQVEFLVEYLLMRGPVNGVYIPEEEIAKVEKTENVIFSDKVKQKVLKEYLNQKQR